MADSHSDALLYIAIAGAVVAFGAWCVNVFNALKAVQWKRVELASQYLREINSDPELVFACRALDWQGGKLVVPDKLQALLPDGGRTITHDIEVLRAAMDPQLSIQELSADFRLQVYRTAIDGLLSWMTVLSSAVERGLFHPGDMPGMGYWIRALSADPDLVRFISAFGYQPTMLSLASRFKVAGLP